MEVYSKYVIGLNEENFSERLTRLQRQHDRASKEIDKAILNGNRCYSRRNLDLKYDIICNTIKYLKNWGKNNIIEKEAII